MAVIVGVTVVVWLSYWQVNLKLGSPHIQKLALIVFVEVTVVRVSDVVKVSVTGDGVSIARHAHALVTAAAPFVLENFLRHRGAKNIGV